MIGILTELAPLLVIFFAGYGLKRIGLLTAADGSSLLRLLFYVGLPALIITTLGTVRLSADMIWLAVLPLAIISLTLLVISAFKKPLLHSLGSKTFGALTAGAIIMNTGFLIPFVEQIYGSEGLSRLVLLDTFNGILTFSLVYFVMVRLGNDTPDKKYVLQKIIASPPVWALIIALAINVTDTTMPALLDQSLTFIAGLVGPIILIALGLKFQFRISKPAQLLIGLGLRFVLGGVIGLGLVYLLGLRGFDAHIAMLAAMAPIGFNSITFSEIEKLDSEFAASQVSFSLVLAIVAMPLFLLGLRVLFPL